MYCDQCGKELRDGALFCDQCGRKIADSAGSTAEQEAVTAAAQKEQPVYVPQAPAPVQGQPGYFHPSVQPYYAQPGYGYAAPYAPPAPRRIVHKSERITKGKKNLIMILSIFCFLGYTGGWICMNRIGSAGWEIAMAVTVFALSLHIMFSCLLRAVATWLTALPLMLVTAANTFAWIVDFFHYRTMLIDWMMRRYQHAEIYEYYQLTPAGFFIETALVLLLIACTILYTRATAFRIRDLRSGRIVVTCCGILQMGASFVLFFLRRPDYFSQISYILGHSYEASSTEIYLKWLLPEVLCIACPTALALWWFTMILIVWNTKKRTVTVTYQDQ